MTSSSSGRGTGAWLTFSFGQLNDNSFNIRLTWRAHSHNMDFLDVLVKRDGGGIMHTDAFRKETSTYDFLFASLAHPQTKKPLT
ncbi:hypothetical protein GDO81_026109 [Engystomops pustulosus]|uniref:Uncharacterized protein n=1 Tax=Engystomops pustulosus TaxID=76066 RepID=A0AAV6ZLK2_ENGPU|nr:hypothetical protein GDO81_026109 [Engystomops pustulosus]